VSQDVYESKHCGAANEREKVSVYAGKSFKDNIENIIEHQCESYKLIYNWQEVVSRGALYAGDF
jgi:hypothetical protein